MLPLIVQLSHARPLVRARVLLRHVVLGADWRVHQGVHIARVPLVGASRHRPPTGHVLTADEVERVW